MVFHASTLPLFRLFFVLLVTTIGLGCGGSSHQEFSSLTSEEQQQIRDLTYATLEKYNIPGAVVGVWSEGKGSFVEPFGVANIAPREPMTLNRTFRIGSITKSFIGTVILQLADEGVLQLDESLEKYIPELPGADKITVRMVNNHTSGLANYLFTDNFYDLTQIYNYKKWDPVYLMLLGAEAPPFFSPPGTGWQYSNTNFIIGGLLIERVTGKPVEQVVQERIITPLGLTETQFPTTYEIMGTHSHGYGDSTQLAQGAFEQTSKATTPGTLVDTTNLDPSASWAAGGMTSNVLDLKVWVEALVNGELISAERKKDLFDFISIPNFIGIESFKYGFGLMSIEGYLGHGGEIFGYETLALHHPEKKTTIVIEINNFPTAGLPALEIMTGVDEILFGTSGELKRLPKIYKKSMGVEQP